MLYRSCERDESFLGRECPRRQLLEFAYMGNIVAFFVKKKKKRDKMAAWESLVYFYLIYIKDLLRKFGNRLSYEKGVSIST